MAFTAKDGKPFGNRQKMNAYNDRAETKVKEPNITAEANEPEGDDVSHMPIEDVVAEHGPAQKIEIEHDHEAGVHKVHSHHGEKTHHSEHASMSEAHEHARKAADEAETEEEKTESPEFEAGEREGAKEYKIPGMY